MVNAGSWGRIAKAHGGIESGQRELGVDMPGNRISDHFATASIQNGSQIYKATGNANEGNVRDTPCPAPPE